MVYFRGERIWVSGDVRRLSRNWEGVIAQMLFDPKRTP